MSSDLDRDSLKIGDFITFQDAQLNCYLSVEGKYFDFDFFKLSQQFYICFFSMVGILVEDIVGVEDIISLHDAIFCIHLQRQYSASRELNMFLERYNMDIKSITDESEINYLLALQVSIDDKLLAIIYILL